MTRTATGALAGKLDDTTTTLARIWTITRTDGAIVRLTDADQDLTVDGNVYIAAQGFTASAIMVAAGDPVQGMEIKMPANTAGISGADVDAGLYDGALCDMTLVDHQALTGGTMPIFGGTVGQTGHERALDEVSLSVTGVFSRGRVVDVETWSSTCRADLGDARCQVDIEALKTPITVTGIDSQFTFADSSLVVVDDAFQLGLVHWLTGNNAGISQEIKGNVAATDKITTFTPAPFVIQVGDTADVYPGCDKSLSTCRDVFNNVINFQGEPFIPNGKMQF